jgi:glutamate 5-kinase
LFPSRFLFVNIRASPNSIPLPHRFYSTVIMKPSFKKVVVKFGTNVLSTADGLLDLNAMRHLVLQIAQAKRAGVQLIVVTSGAVGAGRALLQLSDDMNRVVRRQVLAAVGQVKLMQQYASFFEQNGLFCAQVLATKEDFRDKGHYLNMKNCFLALLRDNIVPIVNENDVVSVTELMFTDNDELAGLIAAMINADALLLLSSVNGVLDEHGQPIPEIEPDNKKALRLIQPTRSTFGRGGMATKFKMAQKAAKLGITTFIADGKQPDVIQRILNGEAIGTRFVPEHAQSNLKKRLAHQEIPEKGIITINQGAAERLLDKSLATSLLPVGITAVSGDFDAGDLVKIQTEDGLPLGVGKAQYNAEKAIQYMGQKGKKALIHYDYLYIE